MLKEIGIGVGVAVTIFLITSGFDILPILLMAVMVGLLFYLFRARGMVGQNFSTATPSTVAPIKFADIGGQATAINELKEALDFIRNQEQIIKMGIRPLKGILLTGPPGTGKTLMAKAAANYTDSSFVVCSGSEFIEMFAGVGAQRVRSLFKSAREEATRDKKNSAIIFIDEIDILGGKRGQSSSHQEYDQTLNQLLVELDGVKVKDKIKILVMAATNRADMLDPALLRPGRFDRLVRVELADKLGRLEILKLHCRNKPLADETNLEEIAQLTFGFSGAHLESLANEAAILAMREEKRQIYQHHLLEAIDKVMLGEKLDRMPSKEELKRVAVHEVGHALIGEQIRPGSVSMLTIMPRGQALGYMRQIPEDDTYMHTREYLEDQIQVLLAGLVAEEIILGDRSTGAGNDIDQAIQAASQIVKCGMSELGVVDIDALPGDIRHQAISGVIKKQEEKVHQFIRGAQTTIEKIANTLLVEEKISGTHLRRMAEEYIIH